MPMWVLRLTKFPIGPINVAKVSPLFTSLSVDAYVSKKFDVRLQSISNDTLR